MIRSKALDKIEQYLTEEKTIAEIRKGLVDESTIGEHTLNVFDDIVRKLKSKKEVKK